MKAIITVIGKDKKGIIAFVANACANYGANILDISQTVLREYFSMIMLVDMSDVTSVGFREFSDALKQEGEAHNVDIRVMHEDIFNSMHRI